jgi:hypothetical protein
VSADIAHRLERKLQARDAAARSRLWRARVILALGPLTVTVGIVWALAQPWRLTLLHPFHQGFWWLLAEPPLYVVLVGILFRLVLAPGIVADLTEAGGEAEQ